MSHVTHKNEIFTSSPIGREIAGPAYESCETYGWVMSHTYGCVMSHVYASHVTYLMSHVTLKNEVFTTSSTERDIGCPAYE